MGAARELTYFKALLVPQEPIKESMYHFKVGCPYAPRQTETTMLYIKNYNVESDAVPEAIMVVNVDDQLPVSHQIYLRMETTAIRRRGQT